MIAGDICTRGCRFCNVKTGKPAPLDADEPQHIAQAIKELGIKHAVLTSVDRDDLPDGGAAHWVAVIQAVKTLNPAITMETLIPDFQGRENLITQIIEAKPEVISHNVETVRRLTPLVRSRATYETSLQTLAYIAKSHSIAKSGLMLGLGETQDEILETMDDVLRQGCSVLTIGQYLQPSKTNIEVAEYIHPDIFASYKQIGLSKGFKHVESAPFVRSSYHAEQHIR
ncbi:lipoyl synthase [Bacteroidia bacterium]|nr:lipoyl synthase [Bacteroidia bacterium]